MSPEGWAVPDPCVQSRSALSADNAPTVNVAKAGSGIPVKFSLGGNHGLGVLAAGFPASERIQCLSATPLDELEETSAPG